MMRVELKGGKVLELVIGDLTKQPDLDAIVNSANAELTPGGGVSGAIHRVAGPQLYEEAKKYAPIRVSECVATKAYNLPNRHVIHCLGPVYGRESEPVDELLKKTYVNALKLADEMGVRSVGFPSISTGIFGYPVDEAARVAIPAILGTLPELRNVDLVRMVLWDERTYRAYERALKENFES